MTDQLVYENCPGTPFMNHTCRYQVDEYIKLYKEGLPGTQLRPSNVTGNLSTLVGKDQRILYAMACGIVDIQTSYNWLCWNKTNSTLLPKLIADSQLSMVRDLYEQTGMKDMLLVNLFPVNLTMDKYSSPPGAIATMQKFVDEANKRLLEGAAAFVKEKGDARIEVVDWWTAVANVYKNTSDPALKQWFGEEEVIVYGVCLKGDPNGEGIVETCKDPSRYFYYDGHFSTTAQHYLSDFTLPYVSKLDKDAWTASPTTTTTTTAAVATTVATTAPSSTNAPVATTNSQPSSASRLLSAAGIVALWLSVVPLISI